jgi:hypothetical protein
MASGVNEGRIRNGADWLWQIVTPVDTDSIVFYVDVLIYQLPLSMHCMAKQPCTVAQLFVWTFM